MCQLQKIKYIENVLVRLIKCDQYFEMVSLQNNQFWSQVQNSVGESVCVFWCHLFGNKGDELHFTRFFENESTFTPDAVKSRFLSAMNLSETEYNSFWEDVKNFRDKFISHKEVGATVNFPNIELCRVQAEEYRRVLSEYSTIKDVNEPGWDTWVKYYLGQYLGENQFRIECEDEFKNGVIYISKELTSKGTGRDKAAPVL